MEKYMHIGEWEYRIIYKKVRDQSITLTTNKTAHLLNPRCYHKINFAFFIILLYAIVHLPGITHVGWDFTLLNRAQEKYIAFLPIVEQITSSKFKNHKLDLLFLFFFVIIRLFEVESYPDQSSQFFFFTISATFFTT